MGVSGDVPPPYEDICQQPEMIGPCKGSEIRFAYDLTTGRCNQFTYGGCQGNENNFKTKKLCEQKCVPRK